MAQYFEQVNTEAYDARMERIRLKGNKPFTMPLDQMAIRGLLPTPTVFDSTNASATMQSSQVKEGSMHSMILTRMMDKGMLPTPNARDFKAAQEPEKFQKRKELWMDKNINLQCGLPQFLTNQTGKVSQLNPRFVADMMGFPPNWTELPFQSGDKKASKDMEMQ